MEHKPEYSDMEARALCAEDEVSALRVCIADFQSWLSEPTRGPVIFRREVIERLAAILAQ